MHDGAKSDYYFREQTYILEACKNCKLFSDFYQLLLSFFPEMGGKDVRVLGLIRVVIVDSWSCTLPLGRLSIDVLVYFNVAHVTKSRAADVLWLQRESACWGRLGCHR